MPYSTINSIEISGMASSIPSHKILLKDMKGGSVRTIHKASQFQTTADFGYAAAKYILSKKQIPLEEVGILVFCTKTPDYRGPATAAVLQGRLSLSKDCIAFDVNVGSSGFIYGSQIVGSSLESTNSKYGLLIVGDTATKQITEDENLSIGFSDGASAILFEKRSITAPIYMKTMAFSDYYMSYMISKGGFRKSNELSDQENSNFRSIENNYLKIDKKKLLNFAATEIPNAIANFLEHFDVDSKAYDFLALHQFNHESNDMISKKIDEKFKELPSNYNSYGNTCGNSIPLLLTDCYGKITGKEKHILACAYGEGLSLGLMDMTINTDAIFDVILSNEYYEEGFISHKE